MSCVRVGGSDGCSLLSFKDLVSQSQVLLSQSPVLVSQVQALHLLQQLFSF